MKKLIVVPMILIVLFTAIVACAYENQRIETEFEGMSTQMDETAIISNDVYIKKHVARPWFFLVEITLKNIGKEEKVFDFWNDLKFYAQDSEGEIYKKVEVYTEKKVLKDIHKLKLGPGQSQKLWIHFHGVPMEIKGLRVLYEDIIKKKRILITIIGKEYFEVFAKTQKNPKTPGEVLATFYLLTKEGRYQEAEKLVSLSSLENYRFNQSAIKEFMTTAERIDVINEDFLEADYWNITVKFPDNPRGFIGVYNCFGEERLNEISSGGPINVPMEVEGVRNQRVELIAINGEYKAGEEVMISFAINYANNKYSDCNARLTKQNKQWKIVYDKTFARTPKDPKTLEELTAAFYFLTKEGKYKEVEKMITPECVEDYHSSWKKIKEYMGLVQSMEITDKKVLRFDYWHVSLYCVKDKTNKDCYVGKDIMERIKKGETISLYDMGTQKVELLSINEEYKANSEAIVYFKFNHYGGEDNKSRSHLKFIKENKRWKIISG